MGEGSLEVLRQLHQICLDSIYIYQEGIARMGNPFVRHKLGEYNDHHYKQLTALEGLILARKGQIPSRKASEEGILREVLAILRESNSDSDTLKALRESERVLRETYEQALKSHCEDPELEKVLNHHFAQETDHLVYIREAFAHPEFFQEGGPQP